MLSELCAVLDPAGLSAFFGSEEVSPVQSPLPCHGKTLGSVATCPLDKAKVGEQAWCVLRMFGRGRATCTLESLCERTARRYHGEESR